LVGPPKNNLQEIFYLLGNSLFPVKMVTEKVVNGKVTFQDLTLIPLFQGQPEQSG
jgi:hypothetical protein